MTGERPVLKKLFAEQAAGEKSLYKAPPRACHKKGTKVSLGPIPGVDSIEAPIAAIGLEVVTDHRDHRDRW